MTYLYYEQIGGLTVEATENAITKISFCSDISSPYQTSGFSLIVQQLSEELKAYFTGKLKEFTVPVLCKGTPFQELVWKTLRSIPYGQTWSYKMVAERIDNPKAVRAVGNANNRNSLPIIVPCHRVIGMNGDLVGYAGGLAIKHQLISLENGFTNQRY